jgi:hypothetical protein
MGEAGDHSRISDRVFGVIAVVAASPVFFWFAIRGYPAKGRAAALSAAFVMLVIRFTWHLKNRVWFWATIACFACLHAGIVSLVDWQEKSYPGLTLLPIGMADFLVMYGIIKLFEKSIGRPTGSDERT